ncbi:MAG: hypothetical protein V4773_00280 [Verrucomicrobiota bacterium]
MKKFILTCCLLAASAFAQENVTSELSRIAAIKNDKERLAAFDALAVKFGTKEVATSAGKAIGQWTVTSYAIPGDNVPFVVARIPSEVVVKIRGVESRPILTLSYQGGLIAVSLDFEVPVEAGPMVALMVFDRGKSVELTIEVTPDELQLASFKFDGRDFARQLVPVDSLRIGAGSSSNGTFAMRFSPAGIDEVIKEMDRLVPPRKK